MKPPTTSLNDTLLLLGSCFLAVLFVHFVRFVIGFYPEARGIVRRAASRVSDADLDVEGVVRAAAAFHRTFTALLCTSAPLIVWAVGGVVCSLLRDAGYLIFPWALGSVAILSGVAAWLSTDFRHRRIRQLATRYLTDVSSQRT